MGMEGTFSGKQPFSYTGDDNVYWYNFSREAGNMHTKILAQKFHFQEFVLKENVRRYIRSFK